MTKAATDATLASNDRVRAKLPFDDDTDFALARRGLIAEGDVRQIMNADGGIVWDLDRFSFLAADVPATANPSLWRQSQLASISGLFEVTDGIYQIRGYDLSNMTVVRGESGWIVIDPLISAETAQAGMDLVRRHVADLPVVAAIYTHSHVDHYGGVRGVVSNEDVAAGRVRIVAPVGFLEESVSENVVAGNVMSRRASYMYGNLIGWDPRRGIGAGLGQLTSSGTVTLIPPTDIIPETGAEMTIDGVEIVFRYTPDAEAPSEMIFYFPQFKALCMAELATHTLHNLYTLRGAKVRSAKAWSEHIKMALEAYGAETEVVFASHHWPTWGNEQVVDYLKGQRDLYKYLHDETLRLANHGLTMNEIAEQVELPDGLARRFANRGYYGSVNHDVKAVYVYYLGWFDANPANLHPLPPVETARKTVEYMGGADAVLARAREDYDNGEYRWVAQAVNHVVFADPDNQEARNLQADALEQMGYQAENGTWRDFYLSGAKELRDGITAAQTPATASPDTERAMSDEMLFDFLGVRLNGPHAAAVHLTFNVTFTDTEKAYRLEVANGVLNYFAAEASDTADTSIALKRADLDDIMMGTATFSDKLSTGVVQVDGDVAAFQTFLGLLDSFDFWFNIVTP